MKKDYRKFVYDENQRFIYPTSDWGFKHLFATEGNKDLLIGVLNHLLPEWRIVDLEYITRDITVPVGKLRDATFDVHCQLDDGSRIVVEMQNYARRSFIDRSLVYTTAAILEQFINSKPRCYNVGRTVFIAFTGDLMYANVPHSPVRIGLCDIDVPNTTVLNDKLLQIFVELPKFAGSIKDISRDTPFIEKLAYVLMEMPTCKEIPDNLDEELLRRIFEAADTKRFNDMEKRAYKSAIMSELDYEAALNDAQLDGLEEGRQEGLEEGRQEGLEKGRQEGLEKGRQEGLEKGLQQGAMAERERIAKAMKEAGVDIKVIEAATGLTV